MPNTLKPASTFVFSRTPIVDSTGNPTFAFLKQLQDWNTQLSNGLSSIGAITQPIPVTTPVEGRTEGIGTTLQNLDSAGVVNGPGIDFARAYVNKDTDHINDGGGSPLTGGKVAYAAFVASAPVIGQTLRYDGAHWLPVAIVQGSGAVPSQFITAYDAATGLFSRLQPTFADVAGNLSASQGPTSAYTGTIVTAKLTAGGASGSITVINGIIVGQVQAT